MIEMFCAALFFRPEPLAFRGTLAKDSAVFRGLRLRFIALRRFAGAA
jgi:hypothetical protein